MRVRLPGAQPGTVEEEQECLEGLGIEFGATPAASACRLEQAPQFLVGEDKGRCDLRWPRLRLARRHGNAANIAPAQCQAVEPGKRSVLYGTSSREHPRAGKETADFILTHRVTLPVLTDPTTKRIEGLGAGAELRAVVAMLRNIALNSLTLGHRAAPSGRCLRLRGDRANSNRRCLLQPVPGSGRAGRAPAPSSPPSAAAPGRPGRRTSISSGSHARYGPDAIRPRPAAPALTIDATRRPVRACRRSRNSFSDGDSGSLDRSGYRMGLRQDASPRVSLAAPDLATRTSRHRSWDHSNDRRTLVIHSLDDGRSSRAARRRTLTP